MNISAGMSILRGAWYTSVIIAWIVIGVQLVGIVWPINPLLAVCAACACVAALILAVDRWVDA